MAAPGSSERAGQSSFRVTLSAVAGLALVGRGGVGRQRTPHSGKLGDRVRERESKVASAQLGSAVDAASATLDGDLQRGIALAVGRNGAGRGGAHCVATGLAHSSVC